MKQLKVQEAIRKKEKFQREHEEVSDLILSILPRSTIIAQTKVVNMYIRK